MIKASRKITGVEWIKIFMIASALFLFFGTEAALWKNTFFTRMTPVKGYEGSLLVVESLLMGVYLGVKRNACRMKTAGTGGIIGFLGIACPICNKLLVLLLGAPFLLNYFEPIRLYVGLAGVFLLAYAVKQKLFLEENPAEII